MSQQFTTTLGEAIGHIRRLKPNLDVNLAEDFINQQVRSVLDRRIWAGLVRSSVLPIHPEYNEGSIALTAGSDAVAGTGTNWPVSDVVNTTLAAAVSEPGMQVVVLTSGAGVTADSLLLVGTGSGSEVVSVVDVVGNRIRADFQKAHSLGASVTMSRLAGRQLRLGSIYPIYTIKAIVSATSLLLDAAWAGASTSGVGYSILNLYLTLPPNLKHLMWAVDPQQPLCLQINYPIEHLNVIDPRREGSGPPVLLAPVSPSLAGNMRVEVYPLQRAVRQIHVIYAIQWKELRRSGDLLPSFINPNVFVYGAAALALRTKAGEGKDPYYDPVTANTYYAMSEKELEHAKIADEGKMQTQLKQEYQRIGGLAMGASFQELPVNNAGYSMNGLWW
jgi:hypothetical protein